MTGPRRQRYHSPAFAREFDRLRRLQGEGPSIMARLREICDLAGARVVELGAGSGVMTERLAAEAATVDAFDRSPSMVAFARQSLRWLTNCRFAQAEHTRIPLEDGHADLVVAAWALDSVVFDSGPDEWRTGLDRVVREMRRLARRGGTTAVLAAPLRGERDYLGHLEDRHDFRRRLFRNVWRFRSKQIAREVIGFFLREEVWADYEPHWPRGLAVPAGLWWRVEP